MQGHNTHHKVRLRPPAPRVCMMLCDTASFLQSCFFLSQRGAAALITLYYKMCTTQSDTSFFKSLLIRGPSPAPMEAERRRSRRPGKKHQSQHLTDFSPTHICRKPFNIAIHKTDELMTARINYSTVKDNTLKIWAVILWVPKWQCSTETS